jgi:putative oxidoreductase
MKLPSSRMETIFNLALRLILGAIFIFAGVLKIYQPAKFALDIANYRLLPHELINMFAITLPWVEVLAGLFLILGIWLKPSALLVLAMTMMFFFAISSALARGLNIECGCFGTVGGGKVGLSKLAEDTALLCLAAWLTWRVPEPTAAAAEGPAVADQPAKMTNGGRTTVGD